jgi:hypothetical protein
MVATGGLWPGIQSDYHGGHRMAVCFSEGPRQYGYGSRFGIVALVIYLWTGAAVAYAPIFVLSRLGGQIFRPNLEQSGPTA